MHSTNILMHISAGISQTTVSGTFYCIGQRGEEFRLLRLIFYFVLKKMVVSYYGVNTFLLLKVLFKPANKLYSGI